MTEVDHGFSTKVDTSAASNGKSERIHKQGGVDNRAPNWDVSHVGYPLLVWAKGGDGQVNQTPYHSLASFVQPRTDRQPTANYHLVDAEQSPR